MANCDATSSEVLDLSTLTESVAGDDATEQSEALGSCQAQSIYLITYSQAVKLNAWRRWLKIRNYLDERHRVKVNFSARHSNYYSA